MSAVRNAPFAVAGALHCRYPTRRDLPLDDDWHAALGLGLHYHQVAVGACQDTRLGIYVHSRVIGLVGCVETATKKVARALSVGGADRRAVAVLPAERKECGGHICAACAH
jgi:hypothetical protein